MITLLKQIGIRDRTDYKNSVVLTNIMEGVDGAATFGYSLETVAIQVEDNQTQQYKHIHTFDIRVIEESGDSSVIDAIIAAQKRVDIAGIGVDGYFQFNDVLLTHNKQYDGVLASAYLATTETLTSYVRGEDTTYHYYNSSTLAEKYNSYKTQSRRLRAFAGRNLYDIYELDVTKSNVDGAESSVWQNGTYQGYVNSVNFNGNILTSEVIGSNIKLTRKEETGNGSLYDQIYFPFANTNVTVTANIVEINTESGGNDAKLSLYLREEDLSSGGGSVEKYISITDTGRKSFTTVTNSNVSTLFIAIRPGTVKDSNITFDDIGLYVTGTEPSGAKSLPITDTNPPEPFDPNDL